MSSHLFDPLASSAPLIVYIDYKSPYAYLALDPTYAIEDELGLEIDWAVHTRHSKLSGIGPTQPRGQGG